VVHGKEKNKQQMPKGKAALATANLMAPLVPTQQLQLKQIQPRGKMSGQEESYWAGSSQEQELGIRQETEQGARSTALHATGTLSTCEGPGKTHFLEHKKPGE
jgi:hypothetical protein